MRPTGRLHLGHLHGALANWVRLQEENDCFFFSADWHALTTNYDRTDVVKQAEREMFVDFIAAGIDPQKATLFVQSQVKQHAELFLLLGMITPLGWLERSPVLQGDAREHHRPRPRAVRLPRLPGPHDRGHHPLQGDAGAGRRRPGGPPRAVPRDRAALQLPLRRGLPRAAAAAHRGGEGARHRRPQDVEELRQRHRPRRERRVHDEEDHGHGDRPRPQAPPGSRQPGRLRHLLPAQGLQRRRRRSPGWTRTAGPPGSAASTARRSCSSGSCPDQERMRERREALLARPKDLDDLVQLGTRKAREVGASGRWTRSARR